LDYAVAAACQKLTAVYGLDGLVCAGAEKLVYCSLRQMTQTEAFLRIHTHRDRMIPLSELKISTDEFDAPRLLAHWAWRVPQHFQPLFLSNFGDWFFRDSYDHIHKFDLVAGELKQLADSQAEFEALLEVEEYQREWLMSHLVGALQQSGLTRSRGQCYAFRTPPMLGGQVSPSNIVVWDIAAYQSGMSKVHEQAGRLSPGTKVVIKPEKN
jgi:hypothetical protein